MKNRDLVSSIVWIVLGGLFAVGGLQHGLMRRGVPGPGFLPFFSGVALIFTSLFILIPALRRNATPEKIDFSPEQGSFKKVLLALAALVVFGMGMEYAGFALTTFLFMLLVPRIMDRTRWFFLASMAFVTAVASYLLFVVLLELNLPKGLLEF